MKISNFCREILLLGALLTGSAFAIDPDRGMSQYQHDRWGVDQGFPSSPVYSISQTPDGYLWIGTGAGLVRFDSVNFSLVRDARGTLPSAGVIELAADRYGCLWLRLEDLTLLRYCNGVFERATTASALTKTNRGEVLIEGQNRGVLVFRDGKFQPLVSTSNLSRTPATALAQTPDGAVWMGTRDAGVFRLAPGKTIQELADAKINCLLADRDGRVWIGTDDGLAKWDGSEVGAAVIPASLKNFQALCMVQDGDGNLWVGTDSRGLLRFNAHGVAQKDEGKDAAREAVTALFEDREGSLWIGSGSGLERLRDSAFVTYAAPKGSSSSSNSPVFADEDGRVWSARPGGGLRWMKGGEEGRAAVELNGDVIYSITGRSGELWLGRQKGGLTRLRAEGSSFLAKTYTQADGLVQNSVFSVYETRDGSVWAGTLSAGVSRLSGGKFISYTAADGLASNTVLSILESRDGAMWFATPGGLSSYWDAHWRTYAKKEGLPSVNVNCLLEDSGGVIWAGTAAGLAFGDSRGFRAPPNLPESLKEPILGIAEDKLGGLWVSTLSHVLRVKREALMRGALVDGEVREFGITDGLLGTKGVGRHPSIVTDPEGRVWFSLNRGISSVDPKRLTRKSVPAIVHMQSVAADNEAIALGGDTLHIPGGRKRVTFGFTGLSLSSPEKVRYRYWLDGFDRGWSQPSATPEAVYTNLPPGPYRFRVVASNADGLWSEDEAKIGVVVDSLYWQSWWFIVMILVASMLAGVALYRLRLHQMTRRLNIGFEERLAERTRLARELHDTLLQTIQGSKMVADDGLEDPADTARVYRALERVSVWLAQATQEGRAALSSLRSGVAQHNDLAEAFTRAGEECTNKNSMTFAMTVAGTVREIDQRVRDEVYRIAQEAMRNASRHSEGSRLELDLIYARDLTVRVQDNGIGMDPSLAANGKVGHFGVRGMQERAEHIGARLSMKTSGSGTEVELVVPGNVAFREEDGQTTGLQKKLRRFLGLSR